MRVMIVEDDAIQRIALEQVLRDHKVTSFDTSSAALNARGFDVAILDLMIEDDMSGLRLARHLRKNQPDCHVIIYTSLTAGKHYYDALTVADRVIEKQMGMENIKNALGILNE